MSDYAAPTTAKLRCPICAGVPNRYSLVRFRGRKITLLVECWSGDLNKHSKEHLYLVDLVLPHVEEAKT